jgi:hypothetical protein
MTEGVDGRRWQTRGDRAERRDAEPPSNDTGYAMPGLDELSRALQITGGDEDLPRPATPRRIPSGGAHVSPAVAASDPLGPQQAAESRGLHSVADDSESNSEHPGNGTEAGRDRGLRRSHSSGWDLGMPDSNPVFAIPEHLPQNDEDAHGAYERERCEGGDRNRK